MSTIRDDDTWKIIEKFFSEGHILRHQLGAYSNFIHSSIPEVIEMFNRRVYEKVSSSGEKLRCVVEILDYTFTPPMRNDVPLTPVRCLHINCSYVAQLFITIRITHAAGEPKIHKNYHIGDIPIMVGSELCNLFPYRNNPDELYKLGEDPKKKGGYFVISSKSKDGTAHERVIVSQERAAPNCISPFAPKKPKKFTVYTESRCASHNGCKSTTCIVGFLKKRLNMYMLLPHFEDEIPLCIVFVAYGVKYEDIASYIFTKEELANNSLVADEKSLFEHSLEHSYEFQNQETCLKFIGERKKKKPVVADEATADAAAEIDAEEMAAVEAEVGITYATNLLKDYTFIHTAIDSEKPNDHPSVVTSKLIYLGRMVRSALKLYLGKIQAVDRDHMSNKRVMDVDVLLTQQFLFAFKKLYQDVEKKVNAALETGTGVDILGAMKSTTVTSAFSNALSNNVWARSTATGISQILETFNTCGALSNLRKITVPEVAAGSNSVEPRRLHASHYQVICPAESPEGSTVGLLKNLALLAQISFKNDIYALEKYIRSIEFTRDIDLDGPWISINNSICACFSTITVKEFAHLLRLRRRSGEISREISITANTLTNTVEILCDGGRLCYPALVVNDGVLAIDETTLKNIGNFTWSDLFNKGYIEIIDKNEESDCLIAEFPSDLIKAQAERNRVPKLRMHTHCLLHPSAMYGIGGSIIPFPDHNQSPRNCYQASMGKQAIGIPALNYHNVIGKFHTLGYLQKPLCLSRAGDLLGFNEEPAGQNAVLLIKSDRFNEEDSIELSKSAVELGFGMSFMHKDYHTEARDGEMFRKPTTIPNAHTYRNIGLGGFIKVGSKVEKNDVLICKVSITPDKKEIIDTIVYDHLFPAMIDAVDEGQTEAGYNFIRVKTIQQRFPMVGDKFAARHGQKGTVGMIIPREDLPQCAKTGISPDVILNSLAFPSRMTIAMMIEAVTGTAVSCGSIFHDYTTHDLSKALSSNPDAIAASSPDDGADEFARMFQSSRSCVDATPFRQFDISVVRKELKRLGMSDFCDTLMIDGTTGEPYKGLMFQGLVYYQRLKHMVVDKVHARAKGSKTALTRQPKEGRGQNGGLRIGCQERDTMNGNGCPYLIKDRMLENSDIYTTYVCKICGLQALYNPKIQLKECRACASKQIAKIVVPYATMLVHMEFGGMQAFNRLLTD